MSAGKTGRGGETGQLDKIKTAVKVEKKRARAQASVEKKLRAAKKPASAPKAAPAPTAEAPATPAAVLLPAFAAIHPALAAFAPGLAKMAADADAPKPDFERIAYNMARLVEQGGKALAASLKPPEQGEQASDLSNELQAAIRLDRQGERTLAGRSRADRRGANGAGHEFSWPVVEYAAPALPAKPRAPARSL